MIYPYNSICLIAVILFTLLMMQNSHAVEISHFPVDPHNYTTYREFARSACLPCHYQDIPNGTDLSKQFKTMPDQELKDYLAAILKSGNMPPDSIYREVLYMKFLNIE